MNKNIIDKLYGGFIGLIVGNALGLPHEFKYSVSMKDYSGYLQYPIQYQSRYCSTKYGVVGQISDDITILIATMSTICKPKIQIGEMDYLLITSYIEWANPSEDNLSGCFIYRDKTSHKLFENIKTHLPYHRRKQRVENTMSNTSLIRGFAYLLIKWYYPDHFKELALNNVRLTHDNEINVEITRLYIDIMEKILLNNTFDQIIESLDSNLPMVKNILEQIKNGTVRNLDISRPEWIINTFYVGLLMLKYAMNGNYIFSHVINYTLKYIQGDLSINGAFVGSLIGLYYGYQNLISDEITKKKYRNSINIRFDMW